jgi:hypothetical protein
MFWIGRWSAGLFAKGKILIKIRQNQSFSNKGDYEIPTFSTWPRSSETLQILAFIVNDELKVKNQNHYLQQNYCMFTLNDIASLSSILSHAKISRGFVKNRLKITSETKSGKLRSHSCVFFVWKYHTCDFLGLGNTLENHSCDISSKKTHECGFLIIFNHKWIN